MATRCSRPSRLVVAVALLATAAAALEIGRAGQQESPKHQRALLQDAGSAGPPQETQRLIDTAIELCDGCPPIYGWYSRGGPRVSELSITSGPPIPDPEDTARPTWVVVMNKLAGCTPSRLCEEASAAEKGRFSGHCAETYGTVIRGMAIEMDLANMAAFAEAAKDCVQEVWRDSQVSIQATQQSPPWGLDRIDQAELPLSNTYTFTAYGTGVHAYIIDTGILASHHQFQHQDGRPGTRVRNTYSGFEDDDATDCHGHGTHVAATLGGLTFGVAKNVTLHAIRVLDCQGNAQYSRVIKALDHIANTHLSPAVAVLSLGGEPYNALDIAVKAMVESGISVSVAAGNDKRDACMQSPARVPSVITVAGTTSSDSMYWNSNYGKCVDLFAPGVNILSAVHESNTATGYMTGTSMSAPFVAGAAALFLESNPQALPYTVKQALVTSGVTGQVVNPRGAPNIMLSTKVFSPVVFNPPEFRITELTKGSSFWVSITLAKRPLSTVRMDVDADSVSRGTMTTTSLEFEPSDWNQPQYFAFEPSSSSIRGESFNIFFDLTSTDPEFGGLETFFQVTDARQKLGETKELPLDIPSLPFMDSRDTRQYTHVYNYDCSEWGDSGNGPDVVYKYRPEADVVLDISLCDSDYDSKVYMYKNGEEEAYGCNDDRCGYQSRLRIKLTAGDEFFIVVDGYDGDSGQFVLQVREIEGINAAELPPGEVDESVNPLPDAEGAPNDVEMLSLSLAGCELSPQFTPSETSYSCRMPPGDPEATVTYVTAHAQASVEVTNDSIRRRSRRRRLASATDLSADVASYARVPLRQGLNLVRLNVRSPDLQLERVYEVQVTLVSDVRETWLKSLAFFDGGHKGPELALKPPFAFDQTEYVMGAPGKGNSNLWVEAQPLSESPWVTVMVEGRRLQGDSGDILSGGIALRGGSSVEVVVTAPDGETQTSYQIKVVSLPQEAAADVDCQMSSFGAWEECSRPCGGGLQLRRRGVEVPASGTGAACGILVEERPCNQQACTTDCSVSPFGEWTSCSARCGTGVQTRARHVLVVPTGGGASCPELQEERPCEVPAELCNQDVDCELGPWGEWDSCSANCNGGMQTRSRPILVPKVGGGRSCSVTEESRRCNVQPCTTECEVTDWGRWEGCDSACGPGLQRRHRTVVGMPSEGAASSCPSLSESRPCENPPCAPGQIAYPEGPPAELELGPSPIWSLESIEDDNTADVGPIPEAMPVPKFRWVIYGFDACSSPCGGGTQQRSVQCARIDGDGWETESPSVCESEGVGKMPATTRACNVEECTAPAVLRSDWQPCSAGCDGGIQERAVSCKGPLGMVLPRSSCLDSRATTWQPCSTAPCSSAGKPTWALEPWSKCQVSCGGGLASRAAKCMDRASALRLGAEMEEVDRGLCGELRPDQPLERPCNTRPCRTGIWKVGEWDEGSCGSACASSGTLRTRSVTCVSLESGHAELLDEAECLASGPRPASSAPCGVDCSGCGPGGNCFGNGECEAVVGRNRACRCKPGFAGEFCEVPESCLSGVIDKRIRCCAGPVDAATGDCCPAGSVTDFRGACCASATLDACGVCDGKAVSVDVAGSCCPSVLDAAGLCCTSGNLDECGVCDGDGTTCDTVLDLTFALDGVLDAGALVREGSGVQAQVESFVSQRLVPSDELGHQQGTAAVEKLYSFHTGQDLSINSDPLAVHGAIPSAQMSLYSTGAAMGAGAGPEVQQKPPKPRRRLQQLDAQRQPRPLVAVSDAWLDAGKKELVSASIRLSGVSANDGSPITAARASALLRPEVSERPTDTGVPLELVGVAFIDRRGVCGNGFCEAGERPLVANAALRRALQDALAPCPSDCPIELRVCPSPPVSPDPAAACGGGGKCLHASGVCDCFKGYAGDDCGSCASGFYRTPAGLCTPTASRLAGMSITDKGPAGKAMDNTMVLFVSIGAAIIALCIAIITAALVFLHCKRRQAAAEQQQAEGRANGQQSKAGDIPSPQGTPNLATKHAASQSPGHRSPAVSRNGCKQSQSPMSTPGSAIGVLQHDPQASAAAMLPVTVYPPESGQQDQSRQSITQHEEDDMSYYVNPPTSMAQADRHQGKPLSRTLSFENANQV